MNLILPSNSITIQEGRKPEHNMKRECLLEKGYINGNENFNYYIHYENKSSYSNELENCIIFIHINQLVEENGKTLIYHSMAVTNYNTRYSVLDEGINIFLDLKRKGKLPCYDIKII